MARRILTFDPSFVVGQVDGGWALAAQSPGTSDLGPVERALARLPANERLVVECVVFEKETIAEAGRRLGVSRQRAHALWLRALNKLSVAATRPLGGVADKSVRVCVLYTCGQVQTPTSGLIPITTGR